MTSTLFIGSEKDSCILVRKRLLVQSWLNPDGHVDDKLDPGVFRSWTAQPINGKNGHACDEARRYIDKPIKDGSRATVCSFWRAALHGDSGAYFLQHHHHGLCCRVWLLYIFSVLLPVLGIFFCQHQRTRHLSLKRVSRRRAWRTILSLHPLP